MKKVLLFIIAITSGLASYAQLAKWVITPSYDTLFVKVDKQVLQADSAGWSSLWNLNGKCLFKTKNKIMPFKEGVGVVIKNGTTITGFVDTSGKFTHLPESSSLYGCPYFNNGYLIFHDGDSYGYYTLNGGKAATPFLAKAYPFHHGYATYLTYDNIQKMDDPYYDFLCSGSTRVHYIIRSSNGKEKDFKPKDIQFLSSVGPDGNAVAVIKNKLYLFSINTLMFEPMLWGNEESEKKRHLQLNGDHSQYFLNLSGDEITIRAKYGKQQQASLHFDKELVPVRFNFNGEEVVFSEKSPEAVKYETSMSEYRGSNGLLGLSMNSTKVLPPQFQSVGLMYDNKSFVKIKGKWGIIDILGDLNYSISINKGQDVAFRHQTFETQLRLDLPELISAKEARIDIPESTGCVIDKTSRETKDTESGNFVTYNCTLTIPKSLPDKVTEITYSPVSVSYDDITLFDFPLKLKAWHLKYYNVDPIDSETSVENGVASFTVNINAQRIVGEGDYPFELSIVADSISANYEKISETRYKCTVYNLREGENDLSILVTEKGCPPSVFPFVVTYTKPVPRKRTRESVTVKKKAAEPQPERQKPVLEI